MNAYLKCASNNPGETANSIQPPETNCNAQASGRLCNEKTCYSCNSAREADSQTVRGTLLVSDAVLHIQSKRMPI